MFGGGPMHRLATTREEKAHDTGQTLRRLLGYLKPLPKVLQGPANVALV